MASAPAACENPQQHDKRLNLSAQNSQGNTPLHEIAAKTYASNNTPQKIKQLEENEIQNIKLILKYNPDVNVKNSDGYTSVHLALKNNKSDLLVKALLDHRRYCDYNATDKDGCTALYYAVSPISYKHEGGSTHYSNFNFKFRDALIIKRLLEKGAKVDIAAQNGYSPLLLAVIMRRTDYVKVMLENKDNLSDGSLEQTVNTFVVEGKPQNQICNSYPPTEYYNMTPLLVAVYDNNKEMVGMLITAGADVNVVNENSNNEPYYKMTPVLISVNNNYCNLEMVRLLINGGADVNAVNSNGDNALHMIINNKYTEQPQIARLLVDSGIDLNAKDTSEATALHLAISKDKQDIVTYILEQGMSTPV